MNSAAVFNHLWQSTVFAAVAMLVVWALRHNAARVRFGVWMVASLKFLVPFSVLAALGTRVHWQAAALPAPAAAAAVAHFEPVVMPITVSGGAPAGEAPWAWLLLRLWIVGSVVLAVRWFRQWRRTARLARLAAPLAAHGLQMGVTRAAVEPGVFGVWRPVLLVPQGIENKLTPAEWEALLAHERCHITRRDNLWAALHRVVETVFWFHPLIWWMGARLVAERERACDEAVLRAGGNARAYASGIVGVCRQYMDAPLACAAGISGGPLHARVRAILDGGWGRNLSRSRRALLGVLGAVALLGPVAVGILYAQSQPTHFAVASIRPGEAPSATQKIEFGMQLDPQRLRAENMPLKDLIVAAYNLRPYQVVAPEWMATTPFSVSGTTTVPLSGNAMRALLQPYLIDQFGIKSHWTSKTMAVYALQEVPGGLRLQPAPSAPPLAHKGQFMVPSSPMGRFMLRLSSAGLHLSGMATMDQLAAVLSQQLDRPVVNKTGLAGVYAFDLTFATPDGRVTMGTLPHVPQLNGEPLHMSAPSIFTALPEQAGLKLEKTEAPVRLLVIDSANKTPRGN